MRSSSREPYSIEVFAEYHSVIGPRRSRNTSRENNKITNPGLELQRELCLRHGFCNCWLTIGPTHASHKFHVIFSQTSYHLLHKRPWVHRHKAVPSTHHQRLKAMWKGKRVYLNVIESPFQKDEAHFSEATYFYELPEDGIVALARPWGVPLSMWEDLEGQKYRSDNFDITSTCWPRPSKQNKSRKKRACWGANLPGKVHLVDRRNGVPLMMFCEIRLLNGAWVLWLCVFYR